MAVSRDDVVDGCIPNPIALEEKAELILLSSGIELGLKSVLFITWVGTAPQISRRDVGCIISVSIDLLLPVKTRGYGYQQIHVFSEVSLLVGPKNEMQRNLVQYVDEIVTHFAGEILKARKAAAGPLRQPAP